MGVAVNLNTTQKPMTAAGKSGTQMTKFIVGPRVYVAPVDNTKSPFTGTAFPVQNYLKKTANGVLDASYSAFVDLGSVAGAAKVTYDKKTTDVKTGMDEVIRATYVSGKTATIEFNLAQFDDVALEQVSGLSSSVITSGSIVNYQVGQDDVVQKQLLLVAINKLDSKEVQFFNPAAYLNFVYEDSNDGLQLKVTATLPSFTAAGTLGSSGEGFMSTTIFA